ncbi:GNAT family N-acetyltransferase [Marinococcus luteus]|uniref:GNAT family N-acetyltransferase n=1 Tax=Marinococcus luteus TaxID=1122204 RepID=UPI002ACCA1CF|nr:GNAT family protein [Marinococcus luteus]MDZ5783107.1 GNAT family protein [Marinococcus luteus]
MSELEGNKVFLRQANETDMKQLYEWKYIDGHQEAKKWNAPYIEEEAIFFSAYQEQWQAEIFPDIPAALAIIADQRTIGYTGAYWVDANTYWMETGIVIYDPAYWNGGYGTEAYRLWIDYLFHHTDLHRLGTSTWSANERMMQVAKKLGMKEEARIRDARYWQGSYYDSIKMGILRREWESMKNDDC